MEEQNQKPEWEIYGAKKEDWDAMTSDERNLTRKYYQCEKLLQQVAELSKENELLTQWKTDAEKSLIESGTAIGVLTEQVEKLKADNYKFAVLSNDNYNNLRKQFEERDTEAFQYESDLIGLRERERQLVEALRNRKNYFQSLLITGTGETTVKTLLELEIEYFESLLNNQPDEK